MTMSAVLASRPVRGTLEHGEPTRPHEHGGGDGRNRLQEDRRQRREHENDQRQGGRGGTRCRWGGERLGHTRSFLRSIGATVSIESGSAVPRNVSFASCPLDGRRAGWLCSGKAGGDMIDPISSLIRRSRPLVTAALGSTTLRFLVTGCSAAALFFTLSVVMVKAGLSPFAGTLCAYAVAFVAAYTAQRAWTFRGQHRHRDALPRYLATQVGCAVLSAGLARLLAEAGGLSPVPMAAITTVVSSGASYMLSRYWVFPGIRPMPMPRGAA